jgi:transposase
LFTIDQETLTVPGTSDLASVLPAIGGQEVIVGVDTHKDFHVAAVITVLGTLLGSKTFPTTRTGYRALLKWAQGFGGVRRAGVECTGSYGAALARHLAAAQIEVFEVNQPDKANRRRRGKNDTIKKRGALGSGRTGHRCYSSRRSRETQSVRSSGRRHPCRRRPGLDFGRSGRVRSPPPPRAAQAVFRAATPREASPFVN